MAEHENNASIVIVILLYAVLIATYLAFFKMILSP
jgi:hypothetical protein